MIGVAITADGVALWRTRPSSYWLEVLCPRTSVPTVPHCSLIGSIFPLLLCKLPMGAWHHAVPPCSRYGIALRADQKDGAYHTVACPDIF